MFHMNSHPEGVTIYYQLIIIITVLNLSIKLLLNLNWISKQKIDYKVFLKKNKIKFDIIFADPPYDFTIRQYLEITELIKENEILSDLGELIIEHSSNINLSDNFKNIDERKYGSSVLSFIKKASL